ncbi:MAG: hypothetical protein EBS32_10465 [Actinobacteria bacterium]|nr:hypothetical protein [Actinomycetota bacterium]
MSDGDDHGHHDAHGIHMPGQSWFPLFASFGFFIGAFGLLYKILGVGVGGAAFGFLNVYLWALEGVGGYEINPEVES